MGPESKPKPIKYQEIGPRKVVCKCKRGSSIEIGCLRMNTAKAASHSAGQGLVEKLDLEAYIERILKIARACTQESSYDNALNRVDYPFIIVFPCVFALHPSALAVEVYRLSI